MAAPGLALAASVVAFALDDPSGAWLGPAALAAVGVLLMWGIAVAVRLRYPERRLGALLFAVAVAYSIQALVASSNPWMYSLARAARPAVELLLIWMMLAFPSGRLQGRLDRGILTAGALAVVGLWLPGVMLSPEISLSGQFVVCKGHCPRNIFFVADLPDVSAGFYLAFRVVGTAVLIGTAALLYQRHRRASPLMRRTLTPVLLASILRTLTIAAFLVSGGHSLQLAFTIWAIPLAIGLGLLRGRLYMAKSLQRLVTGLRVHPRIDELRDVMADALSDASLSIAYWLKDGERWVDANGQVLALTYPSNTAGRAVTIVHDADNRPVAALLHDAALLEEPTLVEAVANSMLSALETHRIEVELAASQRSAATAAEHERHRIERDLHDGAQQRLIALRMKLGVTARLLHNDTRRAAALLAELDSDVEAAIAELRAFARGVAPPLLVERGLAEALSEVAQRAALPIQLELNPVGRFDIAIESAVFFCCVEALQNAAKHAGSLAMATLTLRLEGEALQFRVCDNGPGGHAPATETDAGQGLCNMRQRIEALGGQISFGPGPKGVGFCVTGTIPAPARR